MKCLTIFNCRRSLRALNSSAHIVLLRLLLLPLLTLLLCSCSEPFLTSNKWWSPQDRAALLVIYSTLLSIAAIFLTLLSESIVCGQSQEDVMDGIYSRISTPRTFLSANDWRHILMYANFHRYLLSFANFKFIDGTKAGDCILDETEGINSKSVEEFCRWTNGTVFLNDHYPEIWYYSAETFNYYTILLFVAVIPTVGLLYFKFNNCQ
uniref:Transmembrane protein n=1 Tax=Elaeophora elaphi TaxID=1147741 RepID=A0A0R3RUA7_9BILA